MQPHFTQHTQKYPVLVNRTRVIATAEDKANITGFRWTLPETITPGFVERRNTKGKFLDYMLTEPVAIQDVDGRAKHTIKTSYYEADKRTLKDKPKPAFGEWVDGLAGKYNGRKSRNWYQEQLTLTEIINELNSGFAIAPGLFNPRENESKRSAEHILHRLIILLDGDDWTPEHPAPASLNELIKRYPDLPNDFYWVGESINSRTHLKPELRTRLMLVLPEPIHKGETDLWQTVIDTVVSKYPFIARGVGIDKVRLSFGNARPECENKVLGGVVSHETFTQWKQTARENEAKAEQLRVETEKQKAENEARRAEKNAITTELKRRGHSISENRDPIREFCETNPERLLLDNGLATRLSENVWNWYESSQGRSFELLDGVMHVFSGTMQLSHPETDSTKPVNAHRFILYHLHKLDMKDGTKADKRALRCILADAGYGTHPDEYKKAKRVEKVTGVREGLVSPLELRRVEPPLPTETRAERVMRTVEENEVEIKKAFSQKARVVGLRGATGDGKTESVILVAKEGKRVAMTLPNLPVAEQIHNRFLDANCGSTLWHSRFHGYKGDKDAPAEPKITPESPFEERVRAFYQGAVICVDPLKCEVSQKKGIPAPIGVCMDCPVQDECAKNAYLSQMPAAQSTHVLCIAMPKLFIDPSFSGFFTQLTNPPKKDVLPDIADTKTKQKTKQKDRLHVIDEAKAHDMFIDYSLDKERLQQWVRDWSGHKLGMFAEMAIQILEVKAKTLDPYDLAVLVNDYDDDDIAEMARQAAHFRVRYIRSAESKADPETDKPLANHAMQFDNGRIVFIAVDFDAYERLIELGISAMQPAEIEPFGYFMLTASQAFRFGIYSNKTVDDFAEIPRLYESERWTCFQQLKAFAERYKRKSDAPIWYHNGDLHWVIPPVLHDRVKHLVCMSATLQKTGLERAYNSEKVMFIETPPAKWVDGYRAFQVRSGAYPRRSLLEYTPDYKTVIGIGKTGARFIDLIETEIKRDRKVKHVIITVDAIVKMMRSDLLKKHPNLLNVHSFHTMEGLDYTDTGIVFWVLGCPNVKNNVIDDRAKVIYGDDEIPLNYEYDKETGTYLDERLQACWEGEVSALMTQAVGRARLNRLRNTVIVFSNVLIPDFTGRAVGFVPEDLEVASGLDNLKDVANQRTEAENKASETPKKTARQREQEARDLKAEQKAEVYRLYTAGLSPDKISERVNVKRRTVFNWVQARDF